MAKKKSRLSAEPCIYCGSQESRKGREHVIPQSFGSFENNWILDCVCDDCNQSFAKLELAFARDSVEAQFRLHHGLKPPSDASKLLNRRVRMTIRDHDLFEGANVALVEDATQTQVVPYPFPQVGFRKEGEPWVYISEAQLTPEAIAPFHGATNIEVKIIGNDSYNPERLVGRLEELGVTFTQVGRVKGDLLERLWIDHEFNLDRTILRAIAKVSFNYCAKVIGPEFVRHESFDASRQFVRFGADVDWAVVTLAERRALNTTRGEGTNAHWCAVAWALGTRIPVVQLCFFNQFAYQVVLSREFTGDFREIADGHLFDPFTHLISALPFLSARDSHRARTPQQ